MDQTSFEMLVRRWLLPAMMGFALAVLPAPVASPGLGGAEPAFAKKAKKMGGKKVRKAKVKRHKTRKARKSAKTEERRQRKAAKAEEQAERKAKREEAKEARKQAQAECKQLRQEAFAEAKEIRQEGKDAKAEIRRAAIEGGTTGFDMAKEMTETWHTARGEAHDVREAAKAKCKELRAAARQ